MSIRTKWVLLFAVTYVAAGVILALGAYMQSQQPSHLSVIP